ncbi:MAG: type II toxin-antitoxin system VapC family toxin [Actinomycetota bacterium]|nr:type II toxin-antitoxin system VapC family toxin [Actinomycetota bacterium]
MTTYFDSSALVKRYIVEPDSEQAIALINAESLRVTSMITRVEVRRAIARIPSAVESSMAREQFIVDLIQFDVAAVDSAVCDRAAAIAESSGIRSLDSLHLATAMLAGCTKFVTFDRRQAAVAEELGMSINLG